MFNARCFKRINIWKLKNTTHLIDHSWNYSHRWLVRLYIIKYYYKKFFFVFARYVDFIEGKIYFYVIDNMRFQYIYFLIFRFYCRFTNNFMIETYVIKKKKKFDYHSILFIKMKRCYKWHWLFALICFFLKLLFIYFWRKHFVILLYFLLLLVKLCKTIDSFFILFDVKFSIFNHEVLYLKINMYNVCMNMCVYIIYMFFCK